MVCTAHIGGKPTINLMRQFPLLSQSVHQMRSSQLSCAALAHSSKTWTIDCVM